MCDHTTSHRRPHCHSLDEDWEERWEEEEERRLRRRRRQADGWHPLRPSNHDKVQKLHNECFLVDCISDFFNVLCGPRRSLYDDDDNNGKRNWFKAMQRKNYDDVEGNDDRQGQCDGQGDTPVSGL